MRIPEVDTLWQNLAVTPVAADSLTTHAYLEALRRVYTNGGVELRAFTVTPPALWEAHAAHDDLDHLGFPAQFLTLPQVWEQLPEGLLRHTPTFARLGEPLEDFLTLTLLQGGAYVNCDLPPDAVEEAAIAFSEALLGIGNEQVTHYVTTDPWHTWLQDVAWDYTVVAVDRLQHVVWILMLTDTD